MKHWLLILLLTTVSACCQQPSPDNFLSTAAAANDLNGLKQALTDGANINSAPFGSGGKTALMQAAFFGRLEAIQFLIGKGADLNHQDMGGNTALHYTAGRFPDCTKLLIKAGADVNIKDYNGRTVLMKETDPEIRKLLTDSGAKEIKWVDTWSDHLAHLNKSPTPSPTPSPIKTSPNQQ